MSRLLEAAAEGSTPHGSSDVDHVALRRLSSELCRWIGSTACSALLLRALTRARPEHPALDDVRVDDRTPPDLAGVAEARDAHGEDRLSAGLQSTLVEMIELLDRLIGDELCRRLAEQSMAGRNRESSDLHAEEGSPE